MIALATYEAGVCDCGFHRSLTGDMSNVFQPQAETCLVCAGATRYARVLSDQDEKAMKAMGENPSPNARRPNDGRHLYMRKLQQLEVEQLRERHSSRVAQHVPNGQGEERPR